MRGLRRTILVATAAVVLCSGCALRVSRDDYGKFNAILGPEDWSIIDWRFPTSTSEGPLEAPQRLRPELPAIGVPWATGNPQEPSPQPSSSSAGGERVIAGTTSKDEHACAPACDTPLPLRTAAAVDARTGERPATR